MQAITTPRRVLKSRANPKTPPVGGHLISFVMALTGSSEQRHRKFWRVITSGAISANGNQTRVQLRRGAQRRIYPLPVAISSVDYFRRKIVTTHRAKPKKRGIMRLKPALILGSGFHRHVFGDTKDMLVRPLYDWQHLVTQVAARMQVAIPDRVMSPTQRWDTLVLRAAKEGFRDRAGLWCAPLLRQTHFIEKEARHYVATVLNGAVDQYPLSSRAQIPRLKCWGSVISLNFDAAWLPESENLKSQGLAVACLPATRIDHREKRRLGTCAFMVGVDDGAYRRVWFPNGTCIAPETIRMGLHDYGAAAHAIQVAFSHLKKWERKIGLSIKPPEVQLDVCAVALRNASEGVIALSEFMGELPIPLTWVSDFLYRPLVFAGVGMSDQESGLWWLLAQRARNLSRTGTPSNVFILVDANDRTTFWRNKPFGLEPIQCSNWDEGWEKVLLKAGGLSG